jgi:hypothetical protein
MPFIFKHDAALSLHPSTHPSPTITSFLDSAHHDYFDPAAYAFNVDMLRSLPIHSTTTRRHFVLR